MHGTATNAHQGPQAAIMRAEQGQRALSNTFAQLLRDKARWQAVSLLLGATTLLCAGGLTWMALAGVRVEPYVIRVDQLGHEQVLRPASRTPEPPTPTLIHGVVMQWIEHTRAISNDIIVFGSNWDKVADYSTTACLRQLHTFRREQATRQQQGRRVQVQVGTFLPVGGASHSYTIEWREEVYDQGGQLLLEESGLGKATLRIADFTSQTAQAEVDLRRKSRHFRNILGVFVDEVSWTMRPLPTGGKS